MGLKKSCTVHSTHRSEKYQAQILFFFSLEKYFMAEINVSVSWLSEMGMFLLAIAIQI